MPMGPHTNNRSLFIEWHSSGSSGNQVAERRSVGQMAVHWYKLTCDWVHWLFIGQSGIPVAEWQCIGWLQICQKLRIWPKSRLLIGREPKILPSDWSRGPSENVQRGYPYDSEHVPLEWFLTTLALNWFISDCFNRSLGSIEASDRLKDPEMKLYYRDWVPWIQWTAVALKMTIVRPVSLLFEIHLRLF